MSTSQSLAEKIAAIYALSFLSSDVQQKLVADLIAVSVTGLVEVKTATAAAETVVPAVVSSVVDAPVVAVKTSPPVVVKAKIAPTITTKSKSYVKSTKPSPSKSLPAGVKYCASCCANKSTVMLTCFHWANNDKGCTNKKCRFAHFDVCPVLKCSRVLSEASAPPGWVVREKKEEFDTCIECSVHGVAGGKPKFVCAFGEKCHNEYCRFAHESECIGCGREIEEAYKPYEIEQEMEEVLEANEVVQAIVV